MKNSVVIHPSASAASAQAMRTQSPHPDGLDISAKSASPAPQAQAAANLQPSASAPPEGVDFARESGKLPLDLAIVESLAASNSEDRVKKFCGAIVLTGGMANLHNVAWGISSR